MKLRWEFLWTALAILPATIIPACQYLPTQVMQCSSTGTFFVRADGQTKTNVHWTCDVPSGDPNPKDSPVGIILPPPDPFTVVSSSEGSATLIAPSGLQFQGQIGFVECFAGTFASREVCGSGYISVTTIPLIISPSADPSTIVSGAKVTLNANASGGVAPYSYAWTSNPADSSLNNQTGSAGPQVNPATPGTYTYTVTVTDSSNGASQVATGTVMVTVKAPPPTITGVTPNEGSATTGADDVQISGTGFQLGVTVLFGNYPATVVSMIASLIHVTVYAHAPGAVDVKVTNPDGQTATLANGFTYYSAYFPPKITGVSPNTGPTAGGNHVQISGTNFLGLGMAVWLGSKHAAVLGAMPNAITVIAPPNSAGAVDVKVINPDGQSDTLPGGYTYVAPVPPPTITGVSPNTGPTAGGNRVTVSGTGFQSGASVQFGGNQAAIVGTPTPAAISVTAPPNSAGPVNVVVTNPDMQSATLQNGYTYQALTVAVTVYPLSAQVYPGDQAFLTASVTGGFAPLTYSWSPATGLSNAAVFNPTFTAPSTIGQYPFTVTVTDAHGAQGSAGITITVLPQPPTARFQVTDVNTGQIAINTIPVGDTLQVDGSYSFVNTPGATITNYAWWFNRVGINSPPDLSGPNPVATHIYSTAGTVTVFLVVTDSNGSTAQTGVTITVQ